jgi:hypothetical protein
MNYVVLEIAIIKLIDLWEWNQNELIPKQM